MTFSQIPSVRADLQAWQEKYVRLTEQFKAAKTFDEADAIYYEACTCDAEVPSCTDADSTSCTKLCRYRGVQTSTGIYYTRYNTHHCNKGSSD